MKKHKACVNCCEKYYCEFRRYNEVEKCQEVIDFEDMIKLKSGK